MIGRHCRLGCFSPPLLAGLAACLLPGPARAESLTFHNECRAPVVVQALSVNRGMLYRDRPYLLNPGDRTPDIVLPGNKIVTVYDAKVPNRILYRGGIPAGPLDQSFSILPDPSASTVRFRARQGLPGPANALAGPASLSPSPP